MLNVIYSPEFLDHQTGRSHPEKPERLKAIAQAIKSSEIADKIHWRTPTTTTDHSPLPLIETAHTKDYIQKVKEIADTGGGYIDTDTPVSPRSYDVALLAVNAWIDGVELVKETNKPIFVLARPPGHHAESNTGMGFCIFSNAAIAATYALEKTDINRVAILDWDVHHGNGTQSIVENNPNIIYCSLHQYPCYPGTGRMTEKGFHNNVLNLPIPPENDIEVYQKGWEQLVIPFISEFNPDLLIVSAGYDANQADPLANINLKPQDYALFTEYCLGITNNILFGLEGGYDLNALSQSVVATLSKCLEKEK